jgi:hypothetical protein
MTDTKKMSKQEASAAIAELVQQAYGFINAAEKIADEHELSFSFDIAYGMGGTYDPTYEQEYSEGNWHPSSQSC